MQEPAAVPVTPGPTESTLSRDELAYACLSHFLQLSTWFIGPLIVYLVKRQSRFVAFHSLQVLLWQAIVSGLFFLFFAGFFLALLAACGGTISGLDGDPNGNGDGGDPLADGDPNAADAPTVACGDLPVTIRDFSTAHPDFEVFSGNATFTGLVANQLGVDKKPVYAAPGSTPQTTGPAEFNQWYRDVPGTNQTFPIVITLTETSPGLFTYDNLAFFPIDNMGFGNEGNEHNFHFTTELHTRFQYRGQEVFTFTGDDDFWLFINDRLAVDLGGLHPSLSQTLDLDAAAGQLGITTGGTYDMDIFHAERHTTASNFSIATTIDCFVVP